MNNDPINYNDPTGHCLYGNVWVPDTSGGCYGGYCAPGHNPIADMEVVDPGLLDNEGKFGYDLYTKLWGDRSDSAWWWKDPRLTGDGSFSISDFISVVLTMELSEGYKSGYLSQWQEGFVRTSYHNWHYKLRGDGPSSAGMLNQMFGYSGYRRTESKNFYTYTSGAVGPAIATSGAMVNPLVMGHSDWSQGKIADRPFGLGSYNIKDPPEAQHAYIYAFIDNGCNNMTWPSCSTKTNFFYILTGNEFDFWSVWKP